MSENHAQFHGAWCPSITPFDQQGNIDLSALQQHLRWLKEAGTRVVLLMGSIGEFTALTLDERLMLIRETRKMSSLPLVANISATCMADMIRLAEEASHCEYQAVMILPHYYFQQTPATTIGILPRSGATPEWKMVRIQLSCPNWMRSGRGTGGAISGRISQFCGC